MVSFVDEVTLFLRAGHGGQRLRLGAPREVQAARRPRRRQRRPRRRHRARRRPAGHHAARATTARPHRSADNGQPGMGDNRSGAAGEILELPVPVGTVVKDADGNELADLAEPGMRFVVAPGGQGGLGNAALATTKRKAPGFALLGTLGCEGEVTLELKTVADVALVGYPSRRQVEPHRRAVGGATEDRRLPVHHAAPEPRRRAGRRPPLHRRRRARPHRGRQRGQGARPRVPAPRRALHRAAARRSTARRSSPAATRSATSTSSSRELAAYPVPEGQVPLLERPQLIALNKIDVPEARELADFVRPELEARGYRVFEISAVSHEGLRQLGFALGELVDEARARRGGRPARRRASSSVRRPSTSPTSWSRAEGGSYGTLYRVLGAKPERWVQQTDFTNDEAVGFLADRLAKLGVEDELVRAGAVAGSTVVIGPGSGVVFDWEPTLTSDGGAHHRAARHRRSDSTRTAAPPAPSAASEYHERMDAKAEARAELQREREAGIWADGDGRRDDVRRCRSRPPPTDRRRTSGDAAHPRRDPDGDAHRRQGRLVVDQRRERRPDRARSSTPSPRRTAAAPRSCSSRRARSRPACPTSSSTRGPTDLATQQAAASVGQNLLIFRYQDWLDRYGIVAGQVLLTAGDLEHATPRSNAQRAMDRLLGAAHPADRERERHGRDPRDPLRRQRPARGPRRRAHRRRPARAALRRRRALHAAAAPRRAPSASRTCRSATTSPASRSASVGRAGVGTGGAETKVSAARIAAEAGTAVLITATTLVGRRARRRRARHLVRRRPASVTRRRRVARTPRLVPWSIPTSTRP